MTTEYLSSDFNYKKYSLEHLENWLHDAINCEDLTPQDIYDTIVKCVDENIEYHKSNLTKNIEVLSLLKGHRPNVFDASAHDWDNFWWDSETKKSEHYDDFECPIPSQYTEEEMDAMCDVATDKDKCREYNMREAEYYNKRAELDAQYADPYAKLIKEAGGYEWTPKV